MEHLLNDIIELIGNNMPDIRTVDEDYGQLEMLDDSRDSYPLIFPAVLIDAPETSWESIGGLSQKGLCTVSVRLCIDCYDDTHYNSGTTGKILSREEKKRAAPAPARSLHRLRFSSHKDILKVLYCEPRDKGLRIFLYSRSDGIVPAGDYEERTQSQGVTSSGKRVS